ncbi:proteasome-interacting protein cic1, partial [Coemansia sp. RSA 1722]
VTKASKALLKYAEKQKAEKPGNNLLEDDAEPIHMLVVVKHLSRKRKMTPCRIPLRNPIYDETKSVCVITKTSTSAEVAEKLEELSIPQIQEIISVEKLSKEYKPYEARRQLMSMHDLFLADHRVLHSLPKHLGSKFFKTKKFPLPVVLATGDIKAEITKALSSTMFTPASGSTTSVKVGTTAMSAAQLAANVEGVATCIAKYIPGSWDNIQSLGIKTAESLTLPIFNSLTAAPAADSEESKDESMDVDDKPAVSAKESKAKKPKSKAAAKDTEKKSKSLLSRERPAKNSAKKSPASKPVVAATSA